MPPSPSVHPGPRSSDRPIGTSPSPPKDPRNTTETSRPQPSWRTDADGGAYRLSATSPHDSRRFVANARRRAARRSRGAARKEDLAEQHVGRPSASPLADRPSPAANLRLQQQCSGVMSAQEGAAVQEGRATPKPMTRLRGERQSGTLLGGSHDANRARFDLHATRVG